MLRGHVNADLDLIITIGIADVKGKVNPYEVVVDTGFRGELGLA